MNRYVSDRERRNSELNRLERNGGPTLEALESRDQRLDEARAYRERKKAGHAPHFTELSLNDRTSIWVGCAACGWKSESTTNMVEAQAYYDRQHGGNPTGYEQAARDRKAWHLYDACRQNGVDADALTDENVRANVVAYCRAWGKLNDPSPTTWALVMKRLRERPEAGQMTVGDLAGGLAWALVVLVIAVLMLVMLG